MKHHPPDKGNSHTKGVPPGTWIDKFGRERVPSQEFHTDDGRVLHGQEAIQAAKDHYDDLHRDPRRWRIHGPAHRNGHDVTVTDEEFIEGFVDWLDTLEQQGESLSDEDRAILTRGRSWLNTQGFAAAVKENHPDKIEAVYSSPARKFGSTVTRLIAVIRPRERRERRHTARATSSGDSGDDGPADGDGDPWPGGFTFDEFDALVSRALPGHVRLRLFYALPEQWQREAWAYERYALDLRWGAQS